MVLLVVKINFNKFETDLSDEEHYQVFVAIRRREEQELVLLIYSPGRHVFAVMCADMGCQLTAY